MIISYDLSLYSTVAPDCIVPQSSSSFSPIHSILLHDIENGKHNSAKRMLTRDNIISIKYYELLGHTTQMEKNQS
jgi:hypothetical protein